MLKYFLKEENRYVEFYLIDICDSIINVNKISFENLPDEVLGKYISGFVSYNPVWTIKTVNKKELKFLEKNS